MTYITYRPEDFAATHQRVSDRNVAANTGYPAPGRHHEFVSQNRQPTLQLRPLHCEECRIFMSNHLVGNGRVCSSCLFRAQRLAVYAEPLPLNPDSFRHRDDINLTGNDGDGFALMADTARDVKTLNSRPNRIKVSLIKPVNIYDELRVDLAATVVTPTGVFIRSITAFETPTVCSERIRQER